MELQFDNQITDGTYLSDSDGNGVVDYEFSFTVTYDTDGNVEMESFDVDFDADGVIDLIQTHTYGYDAMGNRILFVRGPDYLDPANDAYDALNTTTYSYLMAISC